jgi:hypothetical protein
VVVVVAALHGDAGQVQKCVEDKVGEVVHCFGLFVCVCVEEDGYVSMYYVSSNAKNKQ